MRAATATTTHASGGAGPSLLVEPSAGRSGAMPPLYARNEEEIFFVREGELTFFVGEDVFLAGAGDKVVASRDLPRTFRVDSEQARWLVATSARSAGRYEDFGRALAVPPAAGAGAHWATPEDEAAVTAIGAASGIRVLGPPGLLPADL